VKYIIMSISEHLQKLKMEKLEKNLADGTAFMAENATKEGVISMPEGIQYKVLKEGDGVTFPTINNAVECHYHGTLIDGTVFDSSVQRGQTISFPLSAVIQGWQIAIPKMSVGAKHIIYIPAHLGYGNRQAGSITPGSTLIFEVELFSVK
jgi:FKBP-type peptidyl-prolyl cis-trans isomerase FklB